MKKVIGRFFLFLLIAFIVIGYFIGYVPYLKIKSKAQIVIASAKEMKSVFSKNNIDLLNQKMDDFSKKYADFQKESSSIYWASFIPYIRDYKNGVEAGSHVISAGRQSIQAITPYADLIGFKKGETSFVEKSTEGRLQTAILTLDKVLVKIDTISDEINQAGKLISTIDAKRYPEKLGNVMVRSTIEQMKEQFVGYSSLFVDAKPLLKNIPNIFGSKKEKTYLLLFQNDKERRATGGFLTAYAVFKIKDGKISIERSDDIYALDATINDRPPIPKEILMYHKGVSTFWIRDSNLSSDLVKSVEIFNSLYKKSGAKVNYDGIIFLDSKILVDMLTIFGDTQADGINFSATIDKNCNCPQVLWKLFNIVGEEVGYQKENRKGILGSLMYELFYKAIGFSPSKYWGTLVQMMFKNLEEKHILLYFTDPTIQQSIEKLNFGGRIREYNGDYLHINNVNFAGAKSNLFVTESITSQAIDKNGKLTKEVTVEYKNTEPASNCNRNQERILCLNAILRNWVRVYVPLGSKLIEFKGSTKDVRTYDEFGKTVFEGYLEVPTEGIAKIVVSYTLPDTIKSSNYKIYIQKQPGVISQQLKVILNGKKLLDGFLVKDIEVKN
ncbi:hypothetical protein COY87_01310 [Candidatus Roizmanbacteria bacterium CG_4_10_14_0_8_um_filter_33_9]|uniref:DUF4012 domain-containing protein n=1 Tax=Candidatus Roizmanbacteria bacterium CG_4_10_14_0_8_um_filter_33_9 TaxID=1974826 RepID=A0A2M7QKI9_9BACT|nr:MAG: hypothetical protein COY87_01310 [Candidatus Roizmanbacteria bacterium CG_4_10_14_0_8_um_filter_33_9]